MDIADCYRLLGLSSGASFAEIKASYRRLARQHHPDINLADQRAKDKFIALTEAYKLLISVVQPAQTDEELTKPKPLERQGTDVAPRQPAAIKITRKEKPSHKTPSLSKTEQQLKWNSYQELQQLLKYKRFIRAIALVEDLAQRLPQPEVRQWQAMVYQRWGHQLVNDGQLDEARIYLKKALKTDPHNRSLWSKVEQDFRRMEQIF